MAINDTSFERYWQTVAMGEISRELYDQNSSYGSGKVQTKLRWVFFTLMRDW